jgi:FO synthase
MLADDEVLLASNADDLRKRIEDKGLMPGNGLVTYSRKVFLPVTQLCRDVCHYCTFAKAPRQLGQPYMSLDDVLEIARKGQSLGCKEALFTLGDQPEQRYSVARSALDALGHATTINYVQALAEAVLTKTDLMPHVNAGILSFEQYRRLRDFVPSFGIMLESASTRLCAPGQPHHGSPDKDPAVRLASIEAAGAAQVALTTGLLIGIGETRREILESLRMLHRAHARFGHIQELLIQNFQPKPGTRMAAHPAASGEELLWAVAATRAIFGPEMIVQVPPNLNSGRLAALLHHGVNDWGGVSPLTPDHVNPEAAWPEIDALAQATHDAGFELVERLCLQPPFSQSPQNWCGPEAARKVLQLSDAHGLARDTHWTAGSGLPIPGSGHSRRNITRGRTAVARVVDRAVSGDQLDEADLVTLFDARGGDVAQVTSAADAMRQQLVGDTVTFVANMNINYTNICTRHCSFCAFSKGRRRADLTEGVYNLSVNDIVERARLAVAAGATEVCLQGGIHPEFTGKTYLAICQAVHDAFPDLHIHAFSPLEVTHGAQSSGLSVAAYLAKLKAVGLSTLPGTAAEILDERVRPRLCPDKIDTEQWLAVVRTAHGLGIRTTATIMFGHLDSPAHWARHLLAIRDLQRETGGFTEFVPLPFVHTEAPLYRRGQARKGPTFREVLLMHAVSRLTFADLIPNIQASWVKLGLDGATACLSAGVNDLGGTLMSESISRAAGAVHGQGLTIEDFEDAVAASGRIAKQRTTLYGAPSLKRNRPAPWLRPESQVSA